jgi:hypothetical protein
MMPVIPELDTRPPIIKHLIEHADTFEKRLWDDVFVAMNVFVRDFAEIDREWVLNVCDIG